MRTPLCPLLAVPLSAATRSSFDLHQLLRFHLSFLGYNISQTSSLPWRITKFRFFWDWNIEAMRGEISFLVQPRCLLLLLVLSILLIFALFASKRAEEKEEHPEITCRVFLDVDIDGQCLGRIVIGLYGQVVPKLWKILELCAQGGDIVHHDGRGYESVYGGTFPDENFKTKHSHAGVVSMVNSGPDSNGSLFFITTVKASWLDGEHVVFGKVVQVMDTVFAIEGGAGTYSGKPRKKVVIADSGEIPKSQWDDER